MTLLRGKPGMTVSLLGAECTGKSELAAALLRPLQQAVGGRWTVVPEHLRTWCEQHGRTPLAHEQSAIATEQSRQIAASAQVGHVIADTSAVMTAIYSQVIFGDAGLLQPAWNTERSYTLSCLCADDMPWLPDGIQRDGPHMRERVQRRLEQHLALEKPGFLWLKGGLQSRVSAVVAAVKDIRDRSNCYLFSSSEPNG